MIEREAPPDVNAAWRNAYEEALDYYSKERAPYPDNLARNTAWKTIRLFWDRQSKSRYRKLNPDGDPVAGVYQGQQLLMDEDTPFPPPKKTAMLCKLLELTWIDESGVLNVQRFQEPGLPDVFWNRHTKILYAFPGNESIAQVCATKGAPRRTSIVPRILRNLFSPTSEPDDVFVGLEDEAEMYEIWADRPPRCRYKVEIDEQPVVSLGAADTIVYRSDKWQDEPNPDPDKRGSQEYLHQFGLDVALQETPEEPPSSIVIRGGKLDVLEGGIAH
jgi:hypothetical protein